MRRTRKTNKLSTLMVLLALPLLFAASLGATPAAALPIVADQYTVLLDHFDQGTAQGLPGFGKAVDLGLGDYVKYPVSWNMGRSTQGTVEMWVNPRSDNALLLDLNWFDSPSYPLSGHILHFQLTNGLLTMANWGGGGGGTSPQGSTTIPVDDWTHLALSWGPDGTLLYVNGVVDASSPVNFYPAVLPTDYLYLNYWGSRDLGLVDELHVSDIQRSAEVIQADAQVVPEPGTLLLLGTGLAGLLGWGGRRKT